MRFIEISDVYAYASIKVSARGKVTAKLVRMGTNMCPAYHVTPTSVTKDGDVQFHWDEGARALDSGWYKLEIYVNGCPCTELPVFIPGPCSAELVEQVERQPNCEDPCSTCGNLPVAPEYSCGCPPTQPPCASDLCPPIVNDAPETYVPVYRRG